MSDAEKIYFRRQLVSRMSPVAVAEKRQLARINNSFDFFLHFSEIGRR